tara:strand:+ start:9136 stop:14469 length:5334 start_codon:yes stop_codon:yes gene_type:complete
MSIKKKYVKKSLTNLTKRIRNKKKSKAKRQLRPKSKRKALKGGIPDDKPEGATSSENVGGIIEKVTKYRKILNNEYIKAKTILSKNSSKENKISNLRNVSGLINNIVKKEEIKVKSIKAGSIDILKLKNIIIEPAIQYQKKLEQLIKNLEAEQNNIKINQITAKFLEDNPVINIKSSLTRMLKDIQPPNKQAAVKAAAEQDILAATEEAKLAAAEEEAAEQARLAAEQAEADQARLAAEQAAAEDAEAEKAAAAEEAGNVNIEPPPYNESEPPPKYTEHNKSEHPTTEGHDRYLEIVGDDGYLEIEGGDGYLDVKPNNTIYGRLKPFSSVNTKENPTHVMLYHQTDYIGKTYFYYEKSNYEIVFFKYYLEGNVYKDNSVIKYVKGCLDSKPGESMAGGGPRKAEVVVAETKPGESQARGGLIEGRVEGGGGQGYNNKILVPHGRNDGNKSKTTEPKNRNYLESFIQTMDLDKLNQINYNIKENIDFINKIYVNANVCTRKFDENKGKSTLSFVVMKKKENIKHFCKLSLKQKKQVLEELKKLNDKSLKFVDKLNDFRVYNDNDNYKLYLDIEEILKINTTTTINEDKNKINFGELLLKVIDCENENDGNQNNSENEGNQNNPKNEVLNKLRKKIEDLNNKEDDAIFYTISYLILKDLLSKITENCIKDIMSKIKPKYKLFKSFHKKLFTRIFDKISDKLQKLEHKDRNSIINNLGDDPLDNFMELLKNFEFVLSNETIKQIIKSCIGDDGDVSLQLNENEKKELYNFIEEEDNNSMITCDNLDDLIPITTFLINKIHKEEKDVSLSLKNSITELILSDPKIKGKTKKNLEDIQDISDKYEDSIHIHKYDHKDDKGKKPFKIESKSRGILEDNTTKSEQLGGHAGALIFPTKDYGTGFKYKYNFEEEFPSGVIGKKIGDNASYMELIAYMKIYLLLHRMKKEENKIPIFCILKECIGKFVGLIPSQFIDNYNKNFKCLEIRDTDIIPIYMNQKKHGHGFENPMYDTSSSNVNPMYEEVGSNVYGHPAGKLKSEGSKTLVEGGPKISYEKKRGQPDQAIQKKLTMIHQLLSQSSEETDSQLFQRLINNYNRDYNRLSRDLENIIYTKTSQEKKRLNKFKKFIEEEKQGKSMLSSTTIKTIKGHNTKKYVSNPLYQGGHTVLTNPTYGIIDPSNTLPAVTSEVTASVCASAKGNPPKGCIYAVPGESNIVQGGGKSKDKTCPFFMMIEKVSTNPHNRDNEYRIDMKIGDYTYEKSSGFLKKIKQGIINSRYSTSRLYGYRAEGVGGPVEFENACKQISKKLGKVPFKPFKRDKHDTYNIPLDFLLEIMFEDLTEKEDENKLNEIKSKFLNKIEKFDHLITELEKQLYKGNDRYLVGFIGSSIYFSYKYENGDADLEIKLIDLGHPKIIINNSEYNQFNINSRNKIEKDFEDIEVFFYSLKKYIDDFKKGLVNGLDKKNKKRLKKENIRIYVQELNNPNKPLSAEIQNIQTRVNNYKDLYNNEPGNNSDSGYNSEPGNMYSGTDRSKTRKNTKKGTKKQTKNSIKIIEKIRKLQEEKRLEGYKFKKDSELEALKMRLKAAANEHKRNIKLSKEELKLQREISEKEQQLQKIQTQLNQKQSQQNANLEEQKALLEADLQRLRLAYSSQFQPQQQTKTLGPSSLQLVPFRESSTKSNDKKKACAKLDINSNSIRQKENEKIKSIKRVKRYISLRKKQLKKTKMESNKLKPEEIKNKKIGTKFKKIKKSLKRLRKRRNQLKSNLNNLNREKLIINKNRVDYDCK